MAGLDELDLDRRLSNSVGFLLVGIASSFLAEGSFPGPITLISMSGDEKELSGVRTLYSEGVSAAESFSGEFERDVSEPESVV